MLKAEELNNSLVNRRVEAKTALVGSDCAVKLNTEATVNNNLTVVSSPGNAELNYSLGLYKTLENTARNILRTLLYYMS